MAKKNNDKGIIAVIGGQFGDEGKGAIVDRLCEDPKVLAVARYQGGPNAGHTLHIGDRKIILHQIPSGIVHTNVQCFMGAGMVIDIEGLLEEMNMLSKAGIENVRERLFISPNAHLILPVHKILDPLIEVRRDKKIGTTNKGIGPAYADKAYRIGLRAGDLASRNLYKRLIRHVIESDNSDLNLTLSGKGKSWAVEYCDDANYIAGMVTKDFQDRLYKKMAEGVVVAEGGQGVMLDIDHGTYPYVTSSNTGVGGIISSLAVNHQDILEVIGVFKAYLTRVGEGKFFSEQGGEVGKHLQTVGQEYGSTTGRKRRCGWFNVTEARQAIRANGISQIFLTKLDVLSELKEIKYGVMDGALMELHTTPGWDEEISHLTSLDDLPNPAKEYLRILEKEIGKIHAVSIGPDRSQMFYT